MPQIISIDFPEAPQLACMALENMGLVVLPTDTVYGVGCLIEANAITRVFEAKQRPAEKALPVLAASIDAVQQVVSDFPETAQRLARAFWPGPLTLVLPRRDDLPENLSTLPTIGVRVPDHDGARRVIAAAGGVLAVTSANRADEPPACTVQAAIVALMENVALYLDGGTCPGGQASTVATVEGTTITVLREGPISKEALQEAI